MKKLSLAILLTAAAVSIMFASCDKKLTPPEVYPVEPGVKIYGMVYTQEAAGRDPLNIAFRLNTLLATAKAQNIEFKDINKVKFTVNKVEKELKYFLFHTNNIIPSTDEEGLYTIVYDGAKRADWDFSRSGTIEIRTHGKLLEELNVDETWEVSIKGGKYLLNLDPLDMFYNFQTSIAGDYTIKSVKRTKDEFTWNVKCNDIKTAHQSSPESHGNWNLDIDVSLNGSSMEVGLMRISLVTVSGLAKGYPVDNRKYESSWKTLTPLHYRFLCDKPICGSGKLEVVSKGLNALSAKDFPSDTVVVKWIQSSIACSEDNIVGYNGHYYYKNGNKYIGNDF